jgi:hypothetical protein
LVLSSASGEGVQEALRALLAVIDEASAPRAGLPQAPVPAWNP